MKVMLMKTSKCLFYEKNFPKRTSIFKLCHLKQEQSNKKDIKKQNCRPILVKLGQTI